MKVGVVVFPGTWSDRDCYYVVQAFPDHEVEYVWHKETDLSSFGCIVVPGGFSYGDYLRPGAIARFSPIMSSVSEFAGRGGAVIGICNGFQVLCEAGLLPGVLMRNNHLQFRCQWTHLRVESVLSPFTSRCHAGQILRIPISHYEGNYYVDEDTLNQMETEHLVAFRYCTIDGNVIEQANPNGSVNNIAGILNKERNVLGMMPHPERACESILGSSDGKVIFESFLSR